MTMSSKGTLAYLTQETPLSRIEIVDDAGDVVTSSPDARIRGRAVPSPDGRHIAFSAITEGLGQDIWVYDVDLRVMRQLTQGTLGSHPSWTHDGKRVAFGAPVGRFLWTSSDGSSPVEPIPGIDTLGPVRSAYM